jgi:hypothetical protein
VGAIVVLFMLGAALLGLTVALGVFGVVSAAVFAYATRGVPGRVRWPTTIAVAGFPVTYLFLVLFAWYGPYNSLCEARGVPILGTADVAPIAPFANLAREHGGSWTVVAGAGPARISGVQTVGASETVAFGKKDGEYGAPEPEWFLVDARPDGLRTFPDEATWARAVAAAAGTAPTPAPAADVYAAHRKVWIDYSFLAFEGVTLLVVLVGWVRHVARVWAMRQPSS